MSDTLLQKKCIPCEIGTPPLSSDQAEILRQQVASWTIVDNNLTKEFKFEDFATALVFVNKIGAIAEEEGHHPDIFLSWGKVKVSLTTHAAKGLTENDFVIAAKIDQLFTA